MASAVVNASSANDNEIVAAPGAGKFIRVFGYVLAGAGAVDAKWRSATTDKTGAMTLATASNIVAPFCEVGWFDCAVNEALNLHLSGAVAVRGHVVYRTIG